MTAPRLPASSVAVRADVKALAGAGARAVRTGVRLGELRFEGVRRRCAGVVFFVDGPAARTADATPASAGPCANERADPPAHSSRAGNATSTLRGLNRRAKSARMCTKEGNSRSSVGVG